MPETTEAPAKPTKAETLAKYGSKIRKMLVLAFDNAEGNEGEALAAFQQARTFLKKAEVSIAEIIRPDWGAGPLIVALQRVGMTVLPSGTHVGKTIAQVVDFAPEYIVQLHASGGFRDPQVNSAIALVSDAYVSQMFCQFSGDWET